MTAAANAPTSDIIEFGRPPVRVFTTEHGLPQNTIQAMAFDTLGYLWVGTQDGAARYNARAWRTVAMPNRTLSNFVGAICASRDGSVWFGTNGGGVLHLDRGHWTIYDAASGALPNDQIRCMLETVGRDGEPVLLVGTRGGLARFARGRWSVVDESSGLPNNVVRSLLVTRADESSPTLWVGTRGGLARYRRGEWSTTGVDGGLDGKVVSSLLETAGPAGRTLWAGTDGHGLWRHDGASWSRIDTSSGFGGVTVNGLIETENAAGERVVWVGTERGLSKLDHGRWSTLDDRMGLPHNVIMSLVAGGSTRGDRCIWAGTMGSGLARLELGRWLSIDESSGLPSRSVWSLLETRAPRGGRSMWIGTLGGGLARYEEGAWTTFDTSNGLPDNIVVSLLDTSGDEVETSVCAGTFGGGIAHFRKGEWKVDDTSTGLPQNTALSLLETREPDGTRVLWVGTNGGGLARRHRDQWTVFDTDSGLPNNVVVCLLETGTVRGSRTLWAGTNGGGLASLTDGVWSVHDTSTGLPNNLVMGLMVTEDPDGRTLWVATMGGGIARRDLDAKKPRWRVLTTSTSPAVSSDVVYRFVRDGRGRIYAFTNRGIDRFTPRVPTRDDPSEFTVSTFTTDDGLPTDECNSGASMIDSFGRIWAGTSEGAAVLDPSREVEDVEPKPILIERVFINGRRHSIDDGEALDHDENNLVFEYALLSTFREKATRYRTQLVGFDREASGWTTDWKREYTNLPEGRYAFRVWGRDAAGNVSGPAELAFRVRPAPWRTWWAYGLYTAAAAGLGYAGINYRLQSLNRRNVELEAAIAERTAQLAEKVEELQVSERRALESERQAHEANRAKSVFLSSMSHELRTPLNAILGFAQVMQRSARREGEDRENLDIIERSGEHLLGLINDVLSISKIEAGKLTLSVHPFDFRLLLLGIEEMIRVRAESKGLALLTDVDPEIPQYVLGDEGKLRQVLINLLGNAVKFTDAGGVSLRVNWRDGRAHFEIEDTGYGIGSDEIGKLFQPFQQTASGEQASEGTGLGLAISSNFVQLMGGRIEVESELRRGTVFRFEANLPVADGPEARTEVRRVIGLEAGQPLLRMVVVDDTPANRLLLRRILEPFGFQMREAGTGLEALEIWEHWHPDLMWMDMRLPQMSGFEVLETIRAREDGHRTKVIALTASAFEHDREAILAAGCDDFVAKPYREATVFDKLTEHFGVRFRYDDPNLDPGATDGLDTSELRDRLAAVDSAVRARLAEAALHGDLIDSNATIETIRSTDERLAADLRTMIRAYRFDELLDVLGESR